MKNSLDQYFDQRIEERMREERASLKKEFDDKLNRMKNEIMANMPNAMKKIFAPIFKNFIEEAVPEPAVKPTASAKKKMPKASAKKKPIAKAFSEKADITLYNAITQYDIYQNMIDHGFKDVTRERQKNNGTLVLHDGGKYIYSFINHGDYIIRRTGHIVKGNIRTNSPVMYSDDIQINPSTEKRFSSNVPSTSNLYRYNMYRTAFNDLLEKTHNS